MAENAEAGEEILAWSVIAVSRWQLAFSSRLDRYANLPARLVDLVGDYAGKELFLVEGDSLLLRCFSDPKVDFQG